MPISKVTRSSCDPLRIDGGHACRGTVSWNSYGPVACTIWVRLKGLPSLIVCKLPEYSGFVVWVLEKSEYGWKILVKSR